MTAFEQIEDVSRKFFSLFDNRTSMPDLSGIHEMFCEDGRIIKRTNVYENYSFSEFEKSRNAIFAKGELTDFYEVEVSGKTEIFGNLAHRLCLYRKEGKLNGVYFETYGIKSIQFINTSNGFKILSALWDDEREGFVIDEKLKKNGF